MERTTFAPSARLAPFVSGFEVIETREAVTRTLLPDLGVVVGFRYRGAATLREGAAERQVPDAVFTGLRGTTRCMHTAAGGAIVLAKFREAGAAPFFAAPLHELFGATVGLAELVPRAEVERAASRIAGGDDHASRIALFEEFLLARARASAPEPLVQAAVSAIHSERGSIRVGALARGLQISQDALEKRFRRAVGASPKQFASLVRLRAAIAASRSAGNLSRVAVDAGYYDQSHFIREFRAVTGESPQRFFRAVQYC